MIYNLSASGEKNIAVRFSEFEGLDTVLALEGRVDWVWVDCFNRLPIDEENYRLIKGAGFKLCLVSPELQGRSGEIEPYRDYLRARQLEVDALCTKLHFIPTWSASAAPR
jgi:hypothetical protein